MSAQRATPQGSAGAGAASVQRAAAQSATGSAPIQAGQANQSASAAGQRPGAGAPIQRSTVEPPGQGAGTGTSGYEPFSLPAAQRAVPSTPQAMPIRAVQRRASAPPAVPAGAPPQQPIAARNPVTPPVVEVPSSAASPVAESSVSEVVSEAVSVQRAPEVQVQRAPVQSSSPLARVRLNTSGPAASNPITSTKPLLGTRQLAGYVVAEAAANATPSVQRATRPEPATTPIQRLATSDQSAAVAELPIQRSAALAGPVEVMAAAPAPGSAAATPPLATTPVQSSTAQQPPASNSTASASYAGTPHGINPRATNTNPVQRAVPIH
ncbi:hypothetical protein, partial [Catenulispora pinisilvae]|uniref:hypothetical protein n=1 Tax=Catenulispora pinisilvae TaxID=2705253 RepID=UPI002264BC18